STRPRNGSAVGAGAGERDRRREPPHAALQSGRAGRSSEASEPLQPPRRSACRPPPERRRCDRRARLARGRKNRLVRPVQQLAFRTRPDPFPMHPKGHAALVTGGGSGLGRATAEKLASLGAKVAVLDINLEAAQATAAKIGGIAIACDVADADQT